MFVANRVVACTPAARAADVRRHQRRREAQARCPSLQVLAHDPDRDARAFEPVVLALEALTPRIEVTRPGRCAFPTRGPSRYFGGDTALAHRAVDVVAEVVPPGVAVAVGVADGPFAAAHAARTGRPPAGSAVHVVSPGRTPGYLAPLPLRALERPELVDVLGRLGLRTLGDFAALPAADVLGRFGADGLGAHRLARGLDARPPATTAAAGRPAGPGRARPAGRAGRPRPPSSPGASPTSSTAGSRPGARCAPASWSGPRPSTASAPSGCGATPAPRRAAR